MIWYNIVDMHRNIILFSIIVLYYALSTYALYAFDAGLLVTSVVLFGVPALALSHFTLAPPAVMVSITLLGAGIALLFEGTAQIYGLWYSLGVDEVRLFGLISVEMLVSVMMQVLFLGLLYEVFYDDGIYTPRSAWQRMTFFGVFTVAVIGLLALHLYVFNGFFLEYSYLWLIGSVLASAIAALTLHKDVTVRIFDKLIDFTIVASMPLAISLWLASTNVHKVFGYTDGYIGTFSLYGQSVPIEEIILLFAVPFFVATMYEMYLDNRD